MYELNGVVYSDIPKKIIKVKNVKALDNYILYLEFNDGYKKEFDFRPLLNKSVFMPLLNDDLFSKVYLEYGVPTWNEYIDISPDYLYTN